jgi:hypothetical protein
MRNSHKSQQGLTFISLVALVALIAFGALLVLKLYPPYYGYFKVASAMNSLKQEPGSADMTDADIKKHLLRRFQIDDVDEVTGKDIVIQKTVSGREVSIAYEVRVAIVGNLDAVASFSKTVDMGGR